MFELRSYWAQMPNGDVSISIKTPLLMQFRMNIILHVVMQCSFLHVCERDTAVGSENKGKRGVQGEEDLLNLDLRLRLRLREEG